MVLPNQTWLRVASQTVLLALGCIHLTLPPMGDRPTPSLAILEYHPALERTYRDDANLHHSKPPLLPALLPLVGTQGLLGSLKSPIGRSSGLDTSA